MSVCYQMSQFLLTMLAKKKESFICPSLLSDPWNDSFVRNPACFFHLPLRSPPVSSVDHPIIYIQYICTGAADCRAIHISSRLVWRGGRNLSLTTVRRDSADGIRETPLVFSQIELKQLTGLSKWETDDSVHAELIWENNKKKGTGDQTENKNARCLTNCLCPLGRTTLKPGLEGEEQVSRMERGERWEAEESAGLPAPVWLIHRGHSATPPHHTVLTSN